MSDRSAEATRGGADPQIERYRFGPAQGVPHPVAPYAHAVRAGPLLFVTGQLPVDAESGAVVDGGVHEQTDAVLGNLARVLEACGSSLRDVVMARAYLVSMDDYEAFNRAYEAWFADALPSRTCVAVSGLALQALVEVDVIAVCR